MNDHTAQSINAHCITLIVTNNGSCPLPYTSAVLNAIVSWRVTIFITYRSVDPMSSEHQLLPEHCNVPTDLRIKTESDDSSMTGMAGSSGVSTSHTPLDESSAPITSQSMSLAAVIAAGNETVCSAQGTKLHAA